MTVPQAPAVVTADDFQPHLEKDFRIPGWFHALTLTAVETGSPPLAELEVGQRVPFSLIFAGPPGDIVPEGFYTLQREGGPSFNLYIMPIYTVQRDRQNYQAVFN